MRYINLESSDGPTLADGSLDKSWLADAKNLLDLLEKAPDRAARIAIIKANQTFWGRIRDWLLRLSHDKCWYSEARGIFSVLEVEHYRPKTECQRKPKVSPEDGYWWLAFDWKNYRLCGKVGNAPKGNLFPLADGSPVATHRGVSFFDEIPLFLDPACPGDPDLLTFSEFGRCESHSDADDYTKLRVTTTVRHLNLDQSRLVKARQRVWHDCHRIIEECRSLMGHNPPGPAVRERLNRRKEELRKLVRPESEFSAVAKACLMKTNVGWVMALAAG